MLEVYFLDGVAERFADVLVLLIVLEGDAIELLTEAVTILHDPIGELLLDV
jgi:hypothetical protein